MLMHTPKAVIDVILGVIAITSGSRNLQTYIEDMKTRGQDADRIKEVSDALKLYNSNFNKKNVLRYGSKVSAPVVVVPGVKPEEEEKKEEGSKSALFKEIAEDY